MIESSIRKDELNKQIRKAYRNPFLIINFLIMVLSLIFITLSYILLPVITSLPYYFKGDGESVGVVELFAFVGFIFTFPIFLLLFITTILHIIFLLRGNGIGSIISVILYSCLFATNTVLFCLSAAFFIYSAPTEIVDLSIIYYVSIALNIGLLLLVIVFNIVGLIFIIKTNNKTYHLKCERKELV